MPLGPKTHCVPNQPVDPYADVRIIARYYDLGYLECSVEKRSERGDEVCFTVNPGLRYRVSGVHVVDRDELPGDPLGAPAELAAFFHSAPGSWFSRQTFVDNLSALRRRYRDAGYASVEADPITDLDRRAARISVDVPITRGPLTTIDRVDVVGNVRIPDAAIRASLLLKSGDLFHETRFAESKERLLATGVFESVDISTAAVPGQPDRIVLTVEVKEK